MTPTIDEEIKWRGPCMRTEREIRDKVREFARGHEDYEENMIYHRLFKFGKWILGERDTDGTIDYDEHGN